MECIELHNENESNNRCVSSVIINCVRFCDDFELALMVHVENETSLNRGIFRRLVSFSTEKKSYLENAIVFFRYVKNCSE